MPNINTKPSDWQETTLEEIVFKIFSGGTPNTEKEEYWGGDLNWLSSGETSQNFIYKTKKTITQQGVDNSSTRFAEKNNVVIATAGQGHTRGQVSLLKLNTYINQSVIVIDCDKQIADNIWLYYNLSNRYYELRFISESNSVRGSLTINTLKSLSIFLPPLAEQRAIAAVLSSLDDKIELLRQENETLEQIGQSLFKEWFGKYSVDKPEELPDGWRVGKITEIIQRYSLSYKCDEKDISKNGEIPILDQGSNGIYGYTSRLPDFDASKDNPVIVFTNHTCNYWFIDYPFCAIQNVIPYRGTNGYDVYFLYFMTKGSIEFIEYKGHWPDFEAKDFIIPTNNVAASFSLVAKPILEKISYNKDQINHLSKTRDTLLPKLMSGEVRVK